MKVLWAPGIEIPFLLRAYFHIAFSFLYSCLLVIGISTSGVLKNILSCRRYCKKQLFEEVGILMMSGSICVVFPKWGFGAGFSFSVPRGSLRGAAPPAKEGSAH